MRIKSNAKSKFLSKDLFYKKLKQLCTNQIFSTMADRISSLPDSILCDILSSLPTKEVVATSVLSKRWILLWRSVPSFHFDYNHDKYKEACTHFLQLVDSFLLSRDREQPLHRFCLTFDSTLDQTICIKTWITAAVSGRVQHLDLNCDRDIVMPSVFSCKSLVVLKLNSITVEDFSSVDLPLLKILYLNSVSLPRYLDLSQILSGCPNLEDLEVMGLACETKGKFNRLTKLVRASINENLLPLEIVKDVEVLLLNWVMHVGFVSYYSLSQRKKKGDFYVLISFCISCRYINGTWAWILTFKI